MKREIFRSIFLAALALLTLGAEDSCRAPMDATGNYSGTWSIKIKEGENTVDTVVCGLISLSLEQDVTLDPPDNLKVTGLLSVEDYSCLADAGWPAALIPDPGEVELEGTMGSNDGKLFLASGGIGTGAGAVFFMNGIATADTQKDAELPSMASYTGDWGFGVSVVFLGTVGVGGTFELTRDE